MTRDDFIRIAHVIAHGPESLLAYADCRRCGAPAHPIRGYCGRFCEEASATDARQRESERTLHCHKPGYRARIENLDPPAPEETRDAYARAYGDVDAAMFGITATSDLLGTHVDSPLTPDAMRRAWGKP